MNQYCEYFKFVKDPGFSEELVTEGNPVYSIWWDSGAPGPGAGVEVIWEMGGSYYGILSSEDYPIGPFESMTDAMKATEMDLIMSGATEIDSSEMGDTELVAILRSENEPGFEVTINGVEWQLNLAKQFVPR